MPKTSPHSTRVGTFAIVHGLAEGHFNSRKLSQALLAVGLVPAKPGEADIIISHSGGLYMLPHKPRASLFLHINPANVALRQVARLHALKIRYDYRLSKQRHQQRQWLASLLANAFYFGKMPSNFRMLRQYRLSGTSKLSLPAGQHIFVHNHLDRLCDTGRLIDAAGRQYTFLTLPGNHDDCWFEPEPYARLVQALYN